MKVKTYQARQLDPRTVVVTNADHLKVLNAVKQEAKKAYESLYKIEKIDKAMRDYLIQRIEEL